MPFSNQTLNTLNYHQIFQIEKIKIEENSKLETIGNSAFSNMPVKYIEIPSSIVSLKKFWNSRLSDDIEFKIIKNGEENIIFVDQTFLVGKSDRKSDVFDILYYVSFPDQELTIPSYIKRIDTYSFRYCKQLSIVTFLDDSELESIGDFAFLHSQIESFIVPSHVKEICDNAFCGCVNLRLITFKENSEIQSIGSEVFYNSYVELNLRITHQLKALSFRQM